MKYETWIFSPSSSADSPTDLLWFLVQTQYDANVGWMIDVQVPGRKVEATGVLHVTKDGLDDFRL